MIWQAVAKRFSPDCTVHGESQQSRPTQPFYPAPALYSWLGIESLSASDGWLSEETKMAKPVAKFRAGPVSAAIWENEITVNGKKGVMLKASVERRFKDKDGQWKSSNSFSRNEIPLAVYCLQKSFEHIIGAQQEDDSVEAEAVTDSQA
jgi:hypothetical protein